MTSVALIGPDGAGKTTLAGLLERCEERPMKSLYMGVALSSSNVMLPTTRLVAWLKRREGAPRRDRGPTGAKGDGRVAVAMPPGRRRPFRATARLANRLLEAWFRQLVSAWYQLRGQVVLYDRHFVFDFASEIVAGQRETLDQKLHRWALTYLYPRPSLIIFLDAPGPVLYSRKRELSVPELERRRQAFLRQGERLPNFVRVDATRPLSEVYEQVLALILETAGDRRFAAPAGRA